MLNSGCRTTISSTTKLHTQHLEHSCVISIEAVAIRYMQFVVIGLLYPEIHSYTHSPPTYSSVLCIEVNCLCNLISSAEYGI